MAYRTQVDKSDLIIANVFDLFVKSDNADSGTSFTASVIDLENSARRSRGGSRFAVNHAPWRQPRLDCCR